MFESDFRHVVIDGRMERHVASVQAMLERVELPMATPGALFVLLCGQVYGLLTNWANRSVQMSNARTILTQPAAIEEWELLAFTVIHFATGMIGLRKDLVKKLVCTFDLPSESRQC